MGFIYLFFPPTYVALWDPKLPTDPLVRGFPVFGNSSFMTPSTGQVSIPNYFVSLFIFYIVPYVPFSVPGVLCQCSEVVLWNLPSVRMIFWWICRGEDGLPILFFHHLRTTLKEDLYLPICYLFLIGLNSFFVPHLAIIASFCIFCCILCISLLFL